MNHAELIMRLRRIYADHPIIMEAADALEKVDKERARAYRWRANCVLAHWNKHKPSTDRQ